MGDYTGCGAYVQHKSMEYVQQGGRGMMRSAIILISQLIKILHVKMHFLNEEHVMQTVQSTGHKQHRDHLRDGVSKKGGSL